MAGQYPGGIDAVKLPERVERLAPVEREWRQARTKLPGQDAPSGERIAKEGRVNRRHMQCDASGRVTRDVHHARCAGKIQRLAVDERADLLERRHPQPAAPSAVREEPEERAELDGTPAAHRLGDLAACPRRVQLMDVDRDRSLASQPLGKPDVIGIAVGQDDRSNMLLLRRVGRPATESTGGNVADHHRRTPAP